MHTKEGEPNHAMTNPNTHAKLRCTTQAAALEKEKALTEIKVGSYTGLPAVIKANKDAGLFFFEEKTMAFFNSTLDSQLYADCIFVTSERPRDGDRQWTVRCALADGNIHTLGEFYSHKTLAKARAAAKLASNALKQDGKFTFRNTIYTK